MLPTTTPDPLRLEANYNQFYSALGAGVLMIGIAVAAVLMLGGDQEQLLWTLIIFGGIWGFIIAAIGLSNRYKVERERRDAAALFAGDAWATWRYSLEEWGAELDARRADLEKRRRFGRFAPIMGGIAGIVIGGTVLAIALIGGEDMPAEVRGFLVALAIFFAVLAILLSISGTVREQRKWGARLERATQVAAPWVCLGVQGFYHESDGHTSLRSLSAVKFSKDGSSLRFVQKHPGPRGSTLYHDVMLPLPAAHRDNAQVLVARYRRERNLSD